MKLAVLVACYNRAQTTLASLSRLNNALKSIDFIDSKIFLIDDMSPDKTGELISHNIPEAVVEYGNGHLYWNRGMCAAYSAAQKHGRFDAYLMFNDDVIINIGAVQRLFSEYHIINTNKDIILAGSTLSPDGRAVTYSAFRRLSRYRPLAVRRLLPNGKLQRCDSFNGNFVVIPGRFFEKVGGLDPYFKHGYGDLDLGYVAQRSNIPTYLFGEPIGFCAENTSAPRASTIRKRFQQWAQKPWLAHDSIRERAYIIWKHAPFMAAIVQICLAIARRSIFHIASKFG